ncbi:MAG: hypothetical protein WA941_23520 [Nitrososphaeraceae archaeon]
MNPKISLKVFTGIVAVALVLMWWNFSFVSELRFTEFMLAHALPTFEAEEEAKIDKYFNELVDQYVVPELRPLLENITKNQRTFLGMILGTGNLIETEERLNDILGNAPPHRDPDPEQQALNKEMNDTETARLALGLIPAPSPVQFQVIEETGKGDMMDKIPYTAPGQVSIGIVSGSGNRSVLNNHSDFTPLGWSGTISFDDGTKQKSVSGYGWDRFIMDCNPGTIFGVSVQKDSEYGYLEVFIAGNEIEPVDIDNIDDIWSEAEETYAPYGIVSITSTCPSFDPAVADLSILE